MASSSGVGVVCRRRLAAGIGYEVVSQRGIYCTGLASRYLLAILWPLRPWRRVESQRSLGLGSWGHFSLPVRSGEPSFSTGPGASLPMMTWFLSASDTISNEFWGLFISTDKKLGLSPQVGQRWIWEARWEEAHGRERKEGWWVPAPSRAKGIVEAMQWLGEPVGSRNALPSYLCKSPAFLVLIFSFFKNV